MEVDHLAVGIETLCLRVSRPGCTATTNMRTCSPVHTMQNSLSPDHSLTPIVLQPTTVVSCRKPHRRGGAVSVCPRAQALQVPNAIAHAAVPARPRQLLPRADAMVDPCGRRDTNLQVPQGNHPRGFSPALWTRDLHLNL